MKLFTIDEANVLLPELKQELYKLQVLIDDIDDRYLDLQTIKAKHNLSPGKRGTMIDPYFEQESQLDFMRMEAELQISNFTRKGVLIKSISPGLLDFPAILEGKEVLLCWKQGEEHISHYHGWNEGFMGRKPYP
ncbi:DUF2203 domain-containing protein [Paenibacillus sp. YIM B09110]|uniref:DUF2203 domain-containing protein n=1 Tax=Paenibacillus sp. YIM B09110 TaxID=3126102 RepID=UPI00301E4B80